MRRQVSAECHCGKARARRRCGRAAWSCAKLCGARLACGHRCPRRCHPGRLPALRPLCASDLPGAAPRLLRTVFMLATMSIYSVMLGRALCISSRCVLWWHLCVCMCIWACFRGGALTSASD